MKAPLLISLFNLWKRMGVHRPSAGNTSKSSKQSEGMIERYNWFINNSNMGDDCTYARKCLDLFLEHDYEDIKKGLLEALEEVRKIEGPQFGR